MVMLRRCDKVAATCTEFGAPRYQRLTTPLYLAVNGRAPPSLSVVAACRARSIFISKRPLREQT